MLLYCLLFKERKWPNVERPGERKEIDVSEELTARGSRLFNIEDDYEIRILFSTKLIANSFESLWENVQYFCG